MNANFLMLLTFGAVAAAIAGAYSLVADLYLRGRSRIGRRIDDEFRSRQRGRASKSLMLKDLKEGAFDAAPDNEATSTPRQRLEMMIEQSGLDLTTRKLLLLTLIAGLGLGAALGLFRQNLLIAAVGGLVGAVVPIGYVNFKRKARLEALQAQLPDAFDLMGRVVRAGQTIAQAQQAVADEFAQPIAGEFSYCYEQQNLGLSPELALRDLARRTGLLEIKIFIAALLIQQQAGGNLAELLDKLSDIIRQRQRIRGQIKTLTAEGRLQAIILLALPFAMFFILLILNREYALVLLDHPGLIVGALVGEGVGAVWIRKIVNFDF